MFLSGEKIKGERCMSADALITGGFVNDTTPAVHGVDLVCITSFFGYLPLYH